MLKQPGLIFPLSYPSRSSKIDPMGGGGVKMCLEICSKKFKNKNNGCTIFIILVSRVQYMNSFPHRRCNMCVMMAEIEGGYKKCLLTRGDQIKKNVFP